MPEVKTWGPFTGRQLTTIICVVAVAALFPVGAWAVSGSNTFVTDATSGQHAMVDSAGQLHAVTNVAGFKSWFVSPATTLTGTYVARVTPPAGKALVVRELHLDWFGADASSDPWIAWQVGDPGCLSFISSTSEVADLSTNLDHRVVTFDPGLIVPAGKVLCATRQGTGTFYIKAFGYTVSSSAVSAASLGELSAGAAPH